MAIDIIGEMEAEQKRAKSSSGNASFFVLKDGEKALVRPLLNLNEVASIKKHDYFNPTTKKFEVNALCAESIDLPVSVCKHCLTAKQTNNKKLNPTKYFVIPIWVYGIKNSAGQPVVYTDQNSGEEKAVQGLRYLQLKASSDILSTLLEMYREGTDLTTLDLTISRKGESLDTKYTVLPRPAAPFAVEGVPEQSRDSIIERINDLNPAELIDGPDHDPFGANPPAQQKAVNKVSVPDF